MTLFAGAVASAAWAGWCGSPAAAQEPASLVPLRRPESRRTASTTASRFDGYRVAANDPNVDQSAAAVEAHADQTGEPASILFAPHGPLEETRLTATWLPDDELGFTDFELWSKWTFSTFTPYHTLTFKPGYALRFVDGPDAPDLPPRLHDAYLDVRWLLPFSEEFAIDVGATPGLYGDFKRGTDDAFRLGARGIAIYTHSPQWRFVLGGAYLDRDDVAFMPIAGAIWTPNPDTKYQLVIPQPKLAWRTYHGRGMEEWLFVMGEFGGGSWAVQRATGAADKANYYDLRVSLGWESKMENGPSASLEIGYVFNRRLEYGSGGPTFEPGDTVMFRASVGF